MFGHFFIHFTCEKDQKIQNSKCLFFHFFSPAPWEKSAKKYECEMYVQNISNEPEKVEGQEKGKEGIKELINFGFIFTKKLSRKLLRLFTSFFRCEKRNF